jgi:hypothetical protein
MKTITVDHPLVRSIDLFDQRIEDWERDKVDFDYLSASQLRLLKTCGIAYYLRYAQDNRLVPNEKIIKGSGFHSGMATWQGAKLAKSTVTMDECIEAGKVKVREESELAGLPESALRKLERDMERAIPVGIDTWGNFTPIAVERGFVIHWHDASVLPVMGFPDFIHADNGATTLDYKTAGRAKTQLHADLDIGLTIYATGYRLLHRMSSMNVQLATMIMTDASVKPQLLDSVRTDAHTQILYAICKTQTFALRHGIYVPAMDPDDYKACKGCDLKRECTALLTEPTYAH